MQELNECYQRALKISNYIIQLYNSLPEECSLHTRIKHAIEFGPNPYYGVIPNDGTLFLEMGYLLPSYFHTPLGRFEFAGSGFGTQKIFNEHLETLKLKLGLVEIKPLSKSFEVSLALYLQSHKT